MDPVIDTTEIAKEIGARIREELDYEREAKHVALYRTILADTPEVRVPRAWPELSSTRDERFRRMWRYYLSACAAGFRAGVTDVWQVLLVPAR